MVEAAGGLEEAPAVVQLPLHNLQLEQVPEDELVLGHGSLADDHAQWPVHLHHATRSAGITKVLTTHMPKICMILKRNTNSSGQLSRKSYKSQSG